MLQTAATLPLNTHMHTLLPLLCRLNVNSPDIQPCLQPMITSQLINPDSINVNYSDFVCVSACATAYAPCTCARVRVRQKQSNQKGGPVGQMMMDGTQ